MKQHDFLDQIRCTPLFGMLAVLTCFSADNFAIMRIRNVLSMRYSVDFVDESSASVLLDAHLHILVLCSRVSLLGFIRALVPDFACENICDPRAILQ